MNRILLALLLGMSSIDVYACSCAALPFHEQLDEARLVMLVRVMQTRFDPAGEESWPSRGGPVRAKFELVESLKGEASSVRELYSAYGGGDCGISLLPGLYYLVVATSESPSVRVDMCGGSMSLDGVDPREGRKTASRLRLDAARAYLRDKKIIDPCFDFPGDPFDWKENGRCDRLIRHMLTDDQIK